MDPDPGRPINYGSGGFGSGSQLVLGTDSNLDSDAIGRENNILRRGFGRLKFYRCRHLGRIFSAKAFVIFLNYTFLAFFFILNFCWRWDGLVLGKNNYKYLCRTLPCSTYWRIVWAVVNPQLDSCKHNNTLLGNFYYIQALLNCLLRNKMSTRCE
jgi:hypothetical protein